jgi:hypothetical protein
MRVPPLSLALLLFLVSSPAQSDGFLTGTIVDSKGGSALAEADVWIFDATTAELVTETKTDKLGYFSSDPLPQGFYKIRIKLIVYQDSECKVHFEEFLGVEITADEFEHTDVFDTAQAFPVTNGNTTQIMRPAQYGRCGDIVHCLPATVGIEGYVFDGDFPDPNGAELNGITFQAKNAVNAMPIFEGTSGFKGEPGLIFWREDICGGSSDIKLRFIDPTGEFASEYYLDQPDDFSLGATLDVTPWTKIDQKIILERVSLPDQIVNIGEAVEGMPLPENTTASLVHALDQAHGQLSDENPNNDKSACGLLKGFVNRLQGSLASGEMTQAEYDQLVESVESVRDGLDCKN